MTEKTKRIIKLIALKEGVSPKEVESKMMEAIRVGMASPDPQTQALWKQVFPEGKEPDLDTFLSFMVERVNMSMEQKETDAKDKNLLS